MRERRIRCRRERLCIQGRNWGPCVDAIENIHTTNPLVILSILHVENAIKKKNRQVLVMQLTILRPIFV